MNGIRYYPNFGSVRTVNFTCDVYANDSLHGVCFPTVLLGCDVIESDFSGSWCGVDDDVYYDDVSYRMRV